MIFVPGPILTSQYKVESWPGAKNESSFQTLNSAALIGMAYAILGKQAEEMKTLAVRWILQIPEKKQHASYHNCYNCWDWVDMSDLAHLSLGIDMLITNVRL